MLTIRFRALFYYTNRICGVSRTLWRNHGTNGALRPSGERSEEVMPLYE